MKNILKISVLISCLLSGFVTLGQQPQSQSAPISSINAKYANGVAPGYWPQPQASSGFVLKVSPGTAFCLGAVVQYAGGTFTLSANTTTNIYLNTASSCVPAMKTSAFTTTDLPIAIVTTNSGRITAVVDARTPFNFEASGGGGGTPSFAVILSGTNPNTLVVSGSLSTTGGGTIAATTASALANSRLIGGNSFDGSANTPLANRFIVQGTSDSGLTGSQFLGALASGLLKNTTSTGVLSIANAGSDYLAPTGSSAALSQASGSAYGVVKPDGITCSIVSGLLVCPGTGGISGLTTNVFPEAASATSLKNGPCDDGNTTASVITCTEYMTVKGFTTNDNTKPSEYLFGVTGVAPTVVANSAGWGLNTTLGTAGTYLMPNAPCNGLMSLSNSSGIVTTSCAPFPWSCQPGFGDGTNAIASGSFLQSGCYNDTGKTITLTGVRCFSDNTGTTTANITNGTGTGLLTGAITCTPSFASGTQSGTTTIAAGDFIKLTFVADGTTKQSTVVITGTHL